MAEREPFYSRECMRDFLSTFSSGMRRQMLTDIDLAMEQIDLELAEEPKPHVASLLNQQREILQKAREDLNVSESEWQKINAQKAS